MEDGRNSNTSGQQSIIQNALRELTTLRRECGDYTLPQISEQLHRMDTTRGQNTDRSNELSTISTGTDKGRDEVDQSVKRDGDLQLARICRVFRKSDGRYFSDVIPCGSFEEAERTCRIARQCVESALSIRDRFILISHHEDHVHIIHDCATTKTNPNCRCAWFQKTEIFSGFRRRKRRGRVRPICNQLSLTDVQNILSYFSEGKRTITYLRINGLVERYEVTTTSVQIVGSEERRTEATMEPCEEMDNPELRQEQQESGGRANDDRRCVQRALDAKRSRCKEKCKTILDMLHKYVCYPVKGIFSIDAWLDHPELGFLNETDKDVDAAISNWNKRLCQWTIYDYNKFYTENNIVPVFAASQLTFNDYYYDMDSSFNAICNLLNFQFGHDQEAIYNFLQDVYDVLERRIPKLNTIMITSSPNAGKNFFFDTICAYYQNVGHMCNASKWNLFPFQDMFERRLVLWNEPNFAPEFTDQLKELLGGDSTTVSVKYRQEVPIRRTPIIILSNRKVSGLSHSAFESRICHYSWSPANFLKDYDKKPNPLVIYKVFQHYGVIAKDK